MKNDIVIIVGDFINALSVYKSIKKMKFSENIYSIISSKYKLLPTIYSDKIIPIKLFENKDIIQFILKLPKESKKYLFLTNELYHQIIFDNRNILKENNVFYYFGNLSPSILFDKAKFANLFIDENLIPTPVTLELENWNINKLNFPFVVKFKKSFKERIKTLPIKIVTSEKELFNYLNYIKKINFEKSDLIVQEKLSSKTIDNVSVSGWYSESEECFYQTRKILQHPKEGGTGDLIELMELDNKLMKICKKILCQVEYHGPFEIEFIKSEINNEFKLLELNSRFWMQHGLIEEISGNQITSNYLSINSSSQIKNYKYWVNLPHYLVLLFKLNRRAWKYLPRVIFQGYSPLSLRELILFFIKRK